MTREKFNVAVTGDTGFDIYTEYVQGYCSADGRVKRPEGAFDVEVPSGAELTSLAFRELFGGAIAVQCLIPKEANKPEPERRSITTLLKFLVELKPYKAKVHRVFRWRP